MRILTADEMREVDRRAIEEIGVPSLVLMENAAIGVADALAERFPEASSVAIFCGPGNNGGDGLALARHLDARGYHCRVWLVLRSSPPRGDAAVQLEILGKLGLPVDELRPDADLDAVRGACENCDVLVDALFGTGLSRPLEGHFAELVRWFGHSKTPCLAVDLPSGLGGSTAEATGPHGRAELTVTFAAPKVAHIFPPVSEVMGEVVVADLGIPSSLIDGTLLDDTLVGQLHLLTDTELAVALTERPRESHKGTYGHALIVGGSPGKSGAVVLAARAAVRGGAGLVTAAVPEPLLAAVDAGSVESMTVCLSETQGLSEAPGLAEGKTAVAIGPGLGQNPMTVDMVLELVKGLEAPVVLDADGLNAFSGRLEELAERSGETVLTPHPGEMGRLLGMTSTEVQADRVGSVRWAARESGAIVVLKGYLSLIATPEGEVFVNPTGNPGMASGGSGDVLTGLAVALLAQGYEALTATQLAVFLHGLAGDLALQPGAPESLAAGDLIETLPRAFTTLRSA